MQGVVVPSGVIISLAWRMVLNGDDIDDDDDDDDVDDDGDDDDGVIGFPPSFE